MTRPFLTAEWRSLAMFNFIVDPRLLQPFVPSGTTLDSFQGRTYLSLVGFLFLQTRVLGIPIPFHRNFEEVNLRFYVRRETHGDLRRGVVFIKEIVPRWAIAKVARWWYHENYVSLPMSHRRDGIDTPTTAERARVEYGWLERSRTYRMTVYPNGTCQPLVAGSLEEFIAEHYWGYCAQPDSRTLEYQVEHPSWNVWCDCRGALEGDFPALYGGPFGDVLAPPADSILLADGSPVTVRQPVRI